MDKAKKKKKFTFKYVIPEDLRDFFVNGLCGGATPRSEINIQFYNERHPIPNAVVYDMNNDSTKGKFITKEVGGDAVRVVQTSVVMDLKTAEALRDWLDKTISFVKDKNKEG